MNHQANIIEAQAKIAALEALRGTRDEPPALDAQIGQLRRTVRWHSVRLEQDHHNVGRSSLYARSGRSKRSALISRFPVNEAPLASVLA